MRILGIRTWPSLPVTGVIANDVGPDLSELRYSGYTGNTYIGIGKEDVLVGAWKFEPEPVPDTDGDFAAIIGPEFTQVVWSRTVTDSALVDTGLFPGQGDLTEFGVVPTYDFPVELYNKEN